MDRKRLADIKYIGRQESTSNNTLIRSEIMKWADLSNDAKSILEWVEHVWTGKRQVLKIERGMDFFQPLKYAGDVHVKMTDTLFEEIKDYLPKNEGSNLDFQISEHELTVTLKDGIKLH